MKLINVISLWKSILVVGFVLLPVCSIAEESRATADSVLTNSDTIVVTAFPYETTVDAIGSSITVITKEEIQKKRQPTVLELLRHAPGVTVFQNGGPGATSSVLIRGAESDQTLVLIDGVRVNDSNTGQFSFADLKTDNIERIEILRGPQSVLYGSEAVGGVINIITSKAAQGLSTELSLGGGSNTTQDYSGYIRYGNGTIQSSNSFSFYDTDGISVAQENNGNSEEDSYRNFSFTSGNRLNFSEDGYLDLSLGFTKADKELDDFDFILGAVDNLYSDQEREFFTSSIVVSQAINQYLTPRIELGFNQDNLEGRDPVVAFNNFDIDNQNASAAAELDFRASDDTLATFGYSYEHRTGDNKGNFDESRNVDSFYVHLQQAVSDVVTITGGVRNDEDSAFGREITYRLTVLANHQETGTKLHASYGTGFKAPSFNELYFPDFGNPDLEAETSWGYDVGIEKSFLNGELIADVTFFENQYDGLITFDSSTFLAANIQEAEAKGVESSISLALIDELLADFKYTYMDSEDKLTGFTLPRRPRHSAAVSLYSQPFENFDANLSFLLVNDRTESDGSELDDYTRVDLSMGYTITDSIKSYVRVENLFDTDYEEVSGYGTPGLVAFAGISLTS